MKKEHKTDLDGIYLDHNGNAVPEPPPPPPPQSRPKKEIHIYHHYDRCPHCGKKAAK